MLILTSRQGIHGMYNFTMKPGQAITLGGATLYCTGIKGRQISLSVETAESLDEPTASTRAIDTGKIAKQRLVADINSRTVTEQNGPELPSQKFMDLQW